MKRHTRFWLAAALLLAAAGAASAGGVSVKYQDPDKFSDVPFWEQDRDQVLKELTTHVESLARQLPANQQLSITVTDIDLAGRVEPRRRSLHDLRILRGGAWLYQPRYLRSALRNGYSALLANDVVGFRVARKLV